MFTRPRVFAFFLFLRLYMSRLFLLAVIALSGGINMAQEFAGTQTIPILQFRSYDSRWLRYYNHDEGGGVKLESGSSGIFLFRRVVSPTPLGLAELEDAETIARLVENHGLSFDIRLIDGLCDTEKLREKSRDVLCVPGSKALRIGYIFLALYHPQAHELAALTTTIDNSIGTANPARMARQDAQPSLEDAAAGCGPYVQGQWITAEDYTASGLSLLVNAEDVGNPITDYHCVLPEDGGIPYLQAYSLVSGDGMERARTRDEPDESDEPDEDSRASMNAAAANDIEDC